MNYWICIINKENWNIISSNLIWGVKLNQKKKFEQIEPGDKIIFYLKGGIFKGIFESNSKMFESYEKLFKPHPTWNRNEIFPLRIKIKSIASSTLETNLIEILGKLSFIKKKKNWAAYFFRSIIKINKEDYLVIKNSMRKK